MMKSPFSQNIIAMVWDFDKTLIKSYMQEPLFKRFGIDSEKFWKEVNALPEYYKKIDNGTGGIRVNKDTMYLNHILTYVKSGLLPGLSNQILRECGKELEFYEGLPEFFWKTKKMIEENPKWNAAEIRLEHYVVSTGFAETIRGSQIAQFTDGIFGCEFIETPATPGFLESKMQKNNGEVLAHSLGNTEISQIAIALDNTSKTRYLFEINKGSNKFPDEIDVNSSMPEENRRIPFYNMMYIADGPSDVPAFSILNAHGGATFAIYPRQDKKAFNQVEKMRRDGRIETFGEADYREGSHTWMWLTLRIAEMADAIANRREESLKKSSSAPPQHLNTAT